MCCDSCSLLPQNLPLFQSAIPAATQNVLKNSMNMYSCHPITSHSARVQRHFHIPIWCVLFIGAAIDQFCKPNSTVPSEMYTTGSTEPSACPHMHSNPNCTCRTHHILYVCFLLPFFLIYERIQRYHLRTSSHCRLQRDVKGSLLPNKWFLRWRDNGSSWIVM